MTVRFTARARRDLQSILIQIAVENPRAAIAFEEVVELVADRLSAFPASGRIVASAESIRAITLPRWGYRLFYIADADGVIVLAIRSGRRQPIFE